MPESVVNGTMSQQDSDGSIRAETPDRSLGSRSLNATGEQLDDISVNLDRMYLDSPAPSSLLSGTVSDGAAGQSVPLGNSGISNIFGPRKTPYAPDAEGFDKLTLLEIEDIAEVIGETDWLCDIPKRLPQDFDEDDRSFLDTGLLNIRNSLLNYVTRAIAEEMYAETKRSMLTHSNIAKEAAGSAATFKVNRRSSNGKSQLSSSSISSSSELSFQDTSVDSTFLNTAISFTPPDYSPKVGQLIDSVSPIKMNTTVDMSSDCGELDEPSPREISSIDLSPVGADHHNFLAAGIYADGRTNGPMSARSNLMNETAGSGATFKVVRRSSAGRSILNKTMELFPQQEGNPSSPQRLLNTTINMSPERNPRKGYFTGCGSPSKFNTTIDLSPGEHENQLGATGSSTPPANLNETFVAENGESPSEKSRRVTRNLSYVIRRDEESPNNNSSPQASANTSRCDLNSAFSYDQDTDKEVQGARSSRNTSMEDLNSRVASQIRSLGCSTITRGRYAEHGGRAVPNLEETRLVARTSSTDTYSVAHSSESPTSSGLSSPMDAQSYDDIQSSSEAVRRSMPNLAVIRNATGMRSQLVFPQAGAGQLRKNHYISDSRLSRLGNGDSRPRLRVHGHGSESTSASSSNQGLSGPDNARARGGSNTSTPAALNRIASGIGSGGASRVYSAQALGTSTRASPSVNRPQGSMGNVRTTGMTGPRYTGGLRPPRPTSTSSNVAQQSANTAASRGPGIPVPTFRTQSRIPAPGQFRFSRPNTANSSNRVGGNSSKTSSASQKGPADDWRDGCY